MTENPRVIAGMIDIFGSWIDRFGIDGFRIDTARHVNPEFWQAFVPAMQARARARGIPNFHIFGEVANDDFNVGYLAQHTRRDKLPTVLDFAFKQGALRTIAGTAATEVWRDFFSQDVALRGRRGARDPAADLPWQSRPGPFRLLCARGFPESGRRGSARPRDARPRADVRQPRRPDRLFRRRAGLCRRRRRPGCPRRHVPVADRRLQRQQADRLQPRRPRRATSTWRTRSTG